MTLLMTVLMQHKEGVDTRKLTNHVGGELDEAHVTLPVLVGASVSCGFAWTKMEHG